ncbi:AraC family transcriptional regulator [Ensifer sp. LCM 4579]|uniref:AraC family transcriptional regulator n=1 Tax=Ensifer sp. LCM 4579 TaxID=1848292 RepID=UPI0008D96B2C|nr:AraC family transcriptional regulator [Ensifer sp. LCM 4579]
MDKVHFHAATSFRGTGAEELEAALSTRISPIRVETLSGGSLSFDCEFFSTGTVSFARCSYEGIFQCTRQAESNKLMIFLPTLGKAVFDPGMRQILSAPGQGTIIDGTRSASVQIFGPRQHLALFIDHRKLATHLTRMLERSVNGDLEFHPYIELGTGPGLALTQLVETACNGLRGDAPLRQSPMALASICDAVTHLILEAAQHRYSDQLATAAPLPAPRHVKWAIDFMHANISEPISMDDIAAAAKVSLRTLQQGFRQFRMTTPMAYLLEIRLTAAHQDLMNGHGVQSIADVALKWGFTHLGRFAADYKKRFGVLPSQTLRTGKGPEAGA